MEIEVIKENEDGSVDVVLNNLEPRVTQMLLQEGLIVVLEREIKRLEKMNALPALLKEKEETNE